jgi:AbrB family looped-hinge helix DNA binding protein
MGEQVKVLQKGKITIPANIRQKLGINEGDCVTIKIMDNKVVILPPHTVPNPTEVLRGLGKGLKVKRSIKQELLKASAEGIEEKLSRAK